MLPWDSLFLTKNGHDRYAVLDMEEYRQYEKLMVFGSGGDSHYGPEKISQM